MKCPQCGNECKKGAIVINNAGSLTQALTMATWYPEDTNGKLIKKEAVNLCIKAEGYYCEECMKVYAVFEEK